MNKEGRPYFRYDNPRDQGCVYDAAGTWWQTMRGPNGFYEVRLGRDKPATAE